MHYFTFTVLLVTAFNLGGSTSYKKRIRRDDGSDWSYDGDTGPENWPGECQTGLKQSPINIGDERKRLRGDVLTFEGAYDEELTWVPSWNGHAYGAVLEKDYLALLEGGELDDHYVFQSLHIHWGSEHTVYGDRYTAEMHLVHYNAKYTADEAASKPDGLAVLGIFMQEEDDVEDSPMSDFLQHLTASDSKKFNASLTSLLPNNRNLWIRYQGSLTTPPCSQNVKWTVFLRPVPIRVGLVEISEHHDSSHRPTEPLNGRTIYEFKLRKDRGEKTVGGNGVKIYAPLSSVIFCLFSVLVAGK